MTKSRKYTVTAKMKGRRKDAFVLTFHNGRKAYIRPMTLRDIYLDGYRSLSEAMRNNSAYLWLDRNAVISLKMEDVEIVGFLIKNTGDLYLTSLKVFRDIERSKLARFGIRDIKAVGLNHFVVRKGKIRL